MQQPNSEPNQNDTARQRSHHGARPSVDDPTRRTAGVMRTSWYDRLTSNHYGIELGLIGGSIQGVDYASKLSTRPQLRRGQSSLEKRLYFMWTRPSPLMQFDRQLLRHAGAQLERREMLKFIPPPLENQLAKIELEYASARGHQSLEPVAKTIFTSKAEADGYHFVVSAQRDRKRKD
jgi:hypothetical protein